MLEIGSVIHARVERIEPYGIFLKHGEATIIVLLPEISWIDRRGLKERVQLGQMIDVQLLRYNYPKREFVGSIRRLHPEQNPYRELSRLEPDTVLRATVVNTYGNEATVSFLNGAMGRLPVSRLRATVKAGDEVDVVIAAIEVDDGSLCVEPVRNEARTGAFHFRPEQLTRSEAQLERDAR